MVRYSTANQNSEKNELKTDETYMKLSKRTANHRRIEHFRTHGAVTHSTKTKMLHPGCLELVP